MANGAYPSVSLREFEVHGSVTTEGVVISTPDVNHVRSATMSASSTEGSCLTADKVKDGDTSRASRWSSDYSGAENQWIKGVFAAPTQIKQINLVLFTRDVEPSPSNVASFSIKYTDKDGNVK